MIPFTSKLYLRQKSNGDCLSLDFTQTLLGLNINICSITKKLGSTIFSDGITQRPNVLFRVLVGLTHGVKEYQPLFRLESDFDPNASITCFRCSDRRGHDRFAFAVRADKYDALSFFLADTKSITLMIEQLEVINDRANKTLQVTATSRSR